MKDMHEIIKDRVKAMHSEHLLKAWKHLITMDEYELLLPQLIAMVAIEFELEARNLIRFNEETCEYDFI